MTQPFNKNNDDEPRDLRGFSQIFRATEALRRHFADVDELGRSCTGLNSNSSAVVTAVPTEDQLDPTLKIQLFC